MPRKTNSLVQSKPRQHGSPAQLLTPPARPCSPASASIIRAGDWTAFQRKRGAVIMQSLVSSQHMLTGQHCHSLQHSCASPSIQPLRSGMILSATVIAVPGPLARMFKYALHPWLQAAGDPFRQWSTAKPPIRKGTNASGIRWELQPQHLPAFAGPSAVRSDALRRRCSDREWHEPHANQACPACAGQRRPGATQAGSVPVKQSHLCSGGLPTRQCGGSSCH